MAQNPFSQNPLFRTAGRRIREAARQEFARSDLGKLVSEAKRATSGASGGGPVQLGKVLNKFKSFGPEAAVRQLMGTEFGRFSREIEQYAKRGAGNQRLIDQFLEALGPAGKMIKALVGPMRSGAGMARHLEAALRLVRSFGFEVLPPLSQRSKQPAMTARGKAAAKQYLEALGYTVIPPGEEPDQAGRMGLPFGVSDKTIRGQPRNTIKIPVDGSNRQFPISHPIVTGAMVPTPESSNVHSFGYDVEHWILYVRFKADDPGNPGKKSSSPGSLYKYENVPPRIFLRMMNVKSKGEFVWDQLRVRGTLSGHQYDYALVGITDGYVPRKATLMPDGEWFRKRAVRSNTGRSLLSSRPNELIRKLAFSNGAPNTGRPNGPNRGRPNTGQP